MTSNPEPGLPAAWVSDKEDLALLVKDVKPYTGHGEYAIPDFFGSDEEQREFVAWYRAEREKEIS